MPLSIVVPAYNESSIIEHTLTYLLADGVLNEADIIVVCNGCHDDTVKRTNEFILDNHALLEGRGLTLVVVETEVASKTNAINLGIERAADGDIILLDADIEVSGSVLASLHHMLSETGKDLLAPSVVFDYQRASWLVRQYYSVASTSTYNTDYRFSNVIALSEKAVNQLGKFPEVIADDEYLRRQFSSGQAAICKQFSFQFSCPTNSDDLLSILTRVQRGNYQLAQLKVSDKMAMEKVTVSAPTLIALIVFSGFKLLSKLRAKKQMRQGKQVSWEKDNSSRERLEGNDK